MNNNIKKFIRGFFFSKSASVRYEMHRFIFAPDLIPKYVKFFMLSDMIYEDILLVVPNLFHDA